MDFLALTKEKARFVELDEDLVKRAVNEGFSAARRSGTRSSRWHPRARPRGARRDDSGLDIDALRVVASGVNKLRGPSGR